MISRLLVSRATLLSLVFLLALQEAFVGAFQTSSCSSRRAAKRKPWEQLESSSLLLRNQHPKPERRTIPLTECASTRARAQQQTEKEVNFLMKEFTTASGEIVNPYKILKVSRKAEHQEIRKAYRALSKKFHPDIVRHSKYLPGHCNNHDDVEAHWERIQISYNILSEKKTRKQYDRHEVIHDPGAAMQRAAMGAAVSGVVGIGKGIFHVGASALDLFLGGNDDEQPAPGTKETSTN